MIISSYQFSVYNSQSMHNVTCCLRLEVYYPQTEMRQEVLHHPISNMCRKKSIPNMCMAKCRTFGYGSKIGYPNIVYVFHIKTY